MKTSVAGLAAVALSLAPLCSGAIPIAIDGFAVTLESSGLGASTALTIGPDGSVYAADYAGGRIMRTDGAGGFDLIASGLPFITGITFTSTGRFFASSSTGGSSTIYEIIDGSSQAFATGFSFPTSLASKGEYLYISNSGDGTISQLGLDGTVSQLPVQLSAPNGPFGLSFSDAGALQFIDHGSGGVYSYSFESAPTLLATVTPLGGTFTASGFDHSLFFTDVNTGTLSWLDDGVAATFASGFAAKTFPPPSSARMESHMTGRIRSSWAMATIFGVSGVRPPY